MLLPRLHILPIFLWSVCASAKIGDFCKQGEASGTCQKVSNCGSGKILNHEFIHKPAGLLR